MIPRGFFYKYMFLFLICFLKGKLLLWVFIFYIATAFYYNSNDGTVLVSFMAIFFFLFGIKLHTPEQFGQPADLHPDTLPELIRTASRFIFGQF